jgi:predicted nucleic-acid-binding Zn-ribbon protein
MAFYVSWNHDLEKTDLWKQEIECQKCGSVQQFTVRLYVDKTKLYGLATISKKRFITLVCHGCLTEFESTKEFQGMALGHYDKAVEEYKQKEKAEKQLSK